jgi:hypothetical protein
MSLVERQVRELGRLGLSRVVVCYSPESEQAVCRLRADLGRLYEVEVVFISGDVATANEGGLVMLEGDVVYDERVFRHLFEAGENSAVVSDDAAALYLAAGEQVGEGGIEACLEDERIRSVGLEALGEYVASLRLTMPAFMRRVRRRDEVPAIDHLMYRRTFKGVIDVVARYGYYHLVRWLTRLACRTRLSPNLLTVLSILGIWGAVPCFAFGEYAWGIVAAWAGVLLDSVDGKLARLRLHLSDTMGELEHLSAMPGLGLWFVGLGWYLSGVHSGSFGLLTGAMVSAFVLDKILSGGFKKRHGREIFDYRRLDAWFHLIACRRNVCLVFISVGALLGEMPLAYTMMVLWMLFTLVFHAWRFVWTEVEGVLSARRRKHE